MIPRLVAISPGDGRDLEPWLRALGPAGLPGLLIREPSGEATELLALARRWVPWVCVHLKTPGADRLPSTVPRHLPAHEDPMSWRSRIDGALGQSTHDAAELGRALGAGLEYAFLSPVRTPTSKQHDPRPTLGFEGAGRIAQRRCVLGLGGLRPGDLAEARAAGLYGVALIGGLFGAATPAEAARRLDAQKMNRSSS